MKGFLIMLLISTIALTGCNISNNIDNNTEYKKINAEEAKAIIDSEDVIILDVRTQEEYDSGHIENAVLLPVTEIADKAEEILPDKDAKILIYCRSGNRSATASKDLIRMGYTNVYDFGGINSWSYGIVK
ncbi:rhodanese-like domain-containing protein [Sedimentibacter sp.]|uniref:rhodanese-like domain-containing protein n=1 Tax=Sedimentibacter sp. TaxID=1960295 RepID=UPI000EEE8992|nr:rhodanese-like domain-containing protein [Sedimentibacter sp.]HCX62260.1 rhodanese-like domain-containing protein [Clostridiales bacterium]